MRDSIVPAAGLTLAGLAVLFACEPAPDTSPINEFGKSHRELATPSSAFPVNQEFSLATPVHPCMPIPYHPDREEALRVLPTLSQRRDAAHVAARLGLLTWPDHVRLEDGDQREYYVTGDCSAIEVLFRAYAGRAGRLWLASCDEASFP